MPKNKKIKICKRFSIDLTPEQCIFIDAIVRTSGNSKAGIIRWMVLYYIQHNPISESRLQEYIKIIEDENS